MEAIKKVEKGGCVFYYCESCDYYAKRIDIIKKHLITQKNLVITDFFNHYILLLNNKYILKKSLNYQ